MNKKLFLLGGRSDTMDILDLLLPSHKLAKDIVFTPKHIAQDMIDLLPDEIWNSKTTFLDPVCKSGIFLKLIKKKLMNCDDLIQKFPTVADREEHIINNQLFGICDTEQSYYICQAEVYGMVGLADTIKYIPNFRKMVNNKDSSHLIKALKENFNMQFDLPFHICVVGESSLINIHFGCINLHHQSPNCIIASNSLKIR